MNSDLVLSKDLSMPDQPDAVSSEPRQGRDELETACREWLVNHQVTCELLYLDDLVDLLCSFVYEREDKARMEGMLYALDVIADDMAWEPSRDYYAKMLGLPTKYEEENK